MSNRTIYEISISPLYIVAHNLRFCKKHVTGRRIQTKLSTVSKSVHTYVSVSTHTSLLGGRQRGRERESAVRSVVPVVGMRLASCALQKEH
jgi:hypothetical protein